MTATEAALANIFIRIFFLLLHIGNATSGASGAAELRPLNEKPKETADTEMIIRASAGCQQDQEPVSVSNISDNEAT
jgi:hypothetical protein